MNENSKSITRNSVFSAKFFCLVVILLSGIPPTKQQQRDIKTKWDNRLLPTNSVYEQPRDVEVTSGNAGSSLRSPNENNVMDSSKGNDPSSSYENSETNEKTVNESEDIYEDDYDIGELVEEATNVSGTSGKVENLENPEKNSRNERTSSEITSDASIIQDENYYYYDDYDNSTSSEREAADKDLADYFDGSEEYSVPQEPEKKDKTSLETSSKLEYPKNRSSIEESSVKEDLTLQQASNSSLEEKHPSDDESISQDDEILIGEAVVSVVTTKSVVNGTISVPVSPLPMTTEQINAPNVPNSTPNPGVDYSSDLEEDDVSLSSTDVMETTEDSRIVASVQTSRSISGARFLPFLVIDGVEKNVPDSEIDSKPSEKPLSDVQDENIATLADEFCNSMSSGNRDLNKPGKVLQRPQEHLFFQLVNRRNASKLKPTAATYTEEVAKSVMHASHGAPSHRSSQDYPKSEVSTIWNDTDMWRHKSFESNSNEVLVDGTLGHERSMDRCVDDRKYNMYDSWRSEWNGYYCNQHASTQGSNHFTGYETTHLSHDSPDYDTNF